MRFLTLVAVVALTIFATSKYHRSKIQEPPQAPPMRVESNEIRVVEPVVYCVEDTIPQAPPSKPATVAWHTSYDAAMAESVDTKKSCLILFGTDNCPPCEKMKPILEKFFGEYVLLKLQQKSNKYLVGEFKITQYPSVAVVSPDYKITHKIAGYSEKIGECLSKPYCYCCDNPNCPCGDNCSCDGTCKCEKVIAQPAIYQPVYQPIIQHQPQYQPAQYSQPTQPIYQPSFQPMQNYQPQQTFRPFGGFFSGGGFGSMGGGFSRGGGGGC